MSNNVIFDSNNASIKNLTEAERKEGKGTVACHQYGKNPSLAPTEKIKNCSG